MTLNEIFASINGWVGTVDDIIGDLTDPDTTWINKYLNDAGDMRSYIYSIIRTNSQTHIQKIAEFVVNILDSYQYLVYEYDDAISEIRLGVARAFRTYYDRITWQLESAIALTWNEMVDIENYLMAQIADIEGVSLQVLYDEVDRVDADLRGVIAAIEVEQADQHDGLWSEIERAAGTVYDYVTSEVTALATTVSTWVSELWTYVTSIMDWLTTKFSEFYTQITDWVSNSISAVYARLSREVSTLMDTIIDYYDRAESLVNTAKAWLVSEIGRLGTTLRGLIDAAIAEVTDLLADLELLTDWRFAFFNLALSYPELGFLQVLNRDDETFNRFKPYWQALLARVMAED